MIRQPSLDDPRAKLNRATQHINALEQLLAPLVDRQAYVITREIEREARQQLWRLSSQPPSIPIEASLLIGDALYNLRCALDHLIWQLVLMNRQTPTASNEFPIFKRLEEYETGKTKRLSGVSQIAETLIDGFQPYNRGHHALWALYILSNTDKHRHLYLTVTSVAQTILRFPGELALKDPPIRTMVHTGPIEIGTVLCAFPSDDMEVQFTPTFDVAFRQSDPTLIGASVMDTLRPIQAKVDEVIHSFDPLFA